MDVYVPLTSFSMLQERFNKLDLAEDVGDDDDEPWKQREPGVLRVVDEPWPFPPNYPVAAQPLVALDLLDYPDPTAARIGREVLDALPRLARHSSVESGALAPDWRCRSS
jgi:hypothetical protein